MGILGKKTPERARIAIVIAKLMQSRCHACENSVETSVFGRNLHEPDIDCESCKACIFEEEQILFGGK